MNQREKQRLKTKREIYKSAISLFEKRGFDSVKITEIVKKTGVSVGTFYYHFPTKESLIDEGYKAFDEKLEIEFNRLAPQPGLNTIRFLISEQLEDVKEKGHDITGIFFKNQVGASNTYLFTKDRFLYKKLYESILFINNDSNLAAKVADVILQNSRGVIYDWCLHKGKYDVVENGTEGLNMVLNYYKLNE